jgi:hypothetical protein
MPSRRNRIPRPYPRKYAARLGSEVSIIWSMIMNNASYFLQSIMTSSLRSVFSPANITAFPGGIFRKISRGDHQDDDAEERSVPDLPLQEGLSSYGPPGRSVRLTLSLYREILLVSILCNHPDTLGRIPQGRGRRCRHRGRGKGDNGPEPFFPICRVRGTESPGCILGNTPPASVPKF